MSELVQLLCFCAYVAAAPVPRLPQTAGDIMYRDEILSHGRHLLRFSTTDLLLDWDRFRKHRLHDFASAYAAKVCQGRFEFVEGERLTIYASQVIFKCV